MQGVLDALVKRVLLCAHPVGCVYMSLDSTSPETLFGGTWTPIKGRFLLATGNAEANTDTFFGQIIGGWNAPAGSTGGQDFHILTQSEMPSHSHRQYLYFNAGESYDAYAYQALNSYMKDSIAAYAGNTSTNGGDQPHNNMPPYLSVYMWRRTA